MSVSKFVRKIVFALLNFFENNKFSEILIDFRIVFSYMISHATLRLLHIIFYFHVFMKIT